MTWRVQFYNERSRTLARYRVAAPSPREAVVVARKALQAEHPLARPRRAGSLFERARRMGGQDADGWILYGIARTSGAPEEEAV